MSDAVRSVFVACVIWTEILFFNGHYLSLFFIGPSFPRNTRAKKSSAPTVFFLNVLKHNYVLLHTNIFALFFFFSDFFENFDKRIIQS